MHYIILTVISKEENNDYIYKAHQRIGTPKFDVFSKEQNEIIMYNLAMPERPVL